MLGSYELSRIGAKVRQGGVWYQRVVPLGPNVNDDDVKYIVETIKSAVSG